MNTHRMLCFAITVALAAGSAAAAAEIAVDAKAAAGGGPPYAALADALNAAAAGDTIVLAAGQYTFATPKTAFDGKIVTIKAAKDAAGKVTVSGMSRVGTSFLRFEGLIIPEPVRVTKAKWVQFVRCTFGPTETQSHWGLKFEDCDYVGAYGCAVKTFSSSQMTLGGMRHAEYRFNELSGGASDAFQGKGDDILIEGNWVHDYKPVPKAHPDGIQLADTRRLTVRGNVFDCPNMQTFFFSWTEKETVYEDFVLENNVCTTAAYHGLTTHPSTAMVIRNNLFICDPKHPSGAAAINFKNMKGKCTVQNNLFWQLSAEPRAEDKFSNNIYMQKHWKSGLLGEAAILSTPEACFVDRAKRDYRPKADSPSVGAGAAGTAPEVDILGRKRPKDKPSIGPIEPQKDDKPFMEMWKAYFTKMQAEVAPPEPK